MKKLTYFGIILLTASLLAACAQFDSPKKIKPGDQVGDFLITKGEPGKVIYSFDLDCMTVSDKDHMFCKSSLGEQVNLTMGIYDSTGGGKAKLDENWSNFKYELFIEDRPVDLQAFGTAETYHQSVGGMVRYWNVVIVPNKSGKITISDSGDAGGAAFQSWLTLTVKGPDAKIFLPLLISPGKTPSP